MRHLFACAATASTATSRCARAASRVGDWAATNYVELASVPFYASCMNRIEARFTGLRYFALDGTDGADHATQGGMIRG